MLVPHVKIAANIKNMKSVNKKKVLYISNIEVPYRVRFFNRLAEHCDLTVLYERGCSSNRDSFWANAEKKKYKVKYLNGIKIKNESTFSLKILKYIFSKYDEIVVGCYNSPVQMLAILVMKLFRIPYSLNVDGEVFLDKSFKSLFKRFFLSNAENYLTAGVKSGKSLETIAPKEKIYPYYFSSLSNRELHKHTYASCERNKTVLVVGQYFDYKGMDVALKCALADNSIQYKFVGMGARTDVFKNDFDAHNVKNIEFIDFLQKKALHKEYMACAMLILPSRQECWGLVINEASSFGMPIVSTYGSGAAVEFLEDDYPQYLAQPDNWQDLLKCVKLLLNEDEKEVNKYSSFLKEKSCFYSLEKSVDVHLKAFDIERNYND